MKKILVIIILAIGLASCKKQNIPLLDSNTSRAELRSLSNSEEEILLNAFLNEPHNGQIIIHEGSQMNTTASSIGIGASHDNTLSLNQLMINSNLIDNQHGNTFRFDGIEVPGIFGSTISVNYGDVYIGDLEIPNKILAQSPSSSLAAGDVITWNADGSNDKGVLILVNFNPTMQNEPGMEAYSMQSNLIHVDDNGTFTLTNEMFDGIPDRAEITVEVVRGNYTMLTQGDTNCQLIVFSMSSGSHYYNY
jgi:hypothetical protein